MERLLIILAHPDDEIGVAGTAAHYAAMGVEVGLICATKGEAGEISDPALATPENLAEVREAELRCSCDLIGIRHLFMLGYCDSGMQGTPANEKSTAFIQAKDEDVQHKLVRLFRQFRPDTVITFEPNGWYGHPDHIATGKHATAAYYLCSSADAFPDAGAVWRPSILYHAVMRRSQFKGVATAARELGIDLGGFEDFPINEPDPVEEQITHQVDVTGQLELKWRVMDCHQTQFGEDSPFVRVPRPILEEVYRHEYFIQVSPAAQPGPELLTDLLEVIGD